MVSNSCLLRGSVEKRILSCMCFFLCSICKARGNRTWGVVRIKKIGPRRHWRANQSPSWFSFSDLTAMEMQMLVNFKLCWTASCNKRHGLKCSHRKHSLCSFSAVYFQLSAIELTSPEITWLNWWCLLQAAKMCRLIIIAAVSNWFPECDHQHLSCRPCFQTGQFSWPGDAEC